MAILCVPSNELAASEEGQRWAQWSSFTERRATFRPNPDLSAGIILSTTTPDDASKEAIASTLQQLHATPDRNQLWSSKTSSKLTALKKVRLRGFSTSSSKNERNLAAVIDELTEIERKITVERENIKTYEVETALKKTELERQWAESLLRQSTEDAQHLASLRAQAEQEHRLRLEAARLQQAKIRREGAAALDSARMNYLKKLNQILNESGAEDLLILLEKIKYLGKTKSLSKRLNSLLTVPLSSRSNHR